MSIPVMACGVVNFYIPIDYGYKYEMPLFGQAKNQLKVNSAGVYNVEAAPADCPDFSNRLAVNLVVKEK